MSLDAEKQLRAAVNRVLVKHADCDLSRRIRGVLRLNYDSNTTNFKRKVAAKNAAAAWAFDNMKPAEHSRVLAIVAYKRFIADQPKAVKLIGSRAFYESLRAEGYRLVKCDAFGREGYGPMTIVGVQLKTQKGKQP